MSFTSGCRSFIRDAETRFRFRLMTTVPPGRCSFPSNLRPPLRRHAFCPSFATLEAAPAAERHGRRVFPVVRLGQLGLPGGDIVHELGELVYVARALA
jgi:hypothetical protein